MATYPIKMLRDENQEPFVPMVSADSIYMNDGKSFEEKLAGKIGVENLAEGTGINIETKDDITTISVDFGASDNIIDNLDTTVAGQGPLDARQGNVLKNMIPTIVDSLDSTDATKVLSANQGHELREMSVPTGGSTGQVLKKASDNDHELEWGDAADPNAIVGDGSIMKIIELTYAEYKTLESSGSLRADTEYHITDVEGGTTTYITEAQIQNKIENNVVNNLTTDSATQSLSAAQGKVLHDKIASKVKAMRLTRSAEIKWTGNTTPARMPFDIIAYDSSGGTLTKSADGCIRIGSGVQQVRISGQMSTDTSAPDSLIYVFMYMYVNNVQVYKTIRPLIRWDVLDINDIILDVKEGDVVELKISTNSTGQILLCGGGDYTDFGTGKIAYLQVEVLA